MNKIKKETVIYNDYIVTNDKKRISADNIHAFLTKSYWAKNRSLETVKKSIKNSICYGAIYKNKLVGFARVVTDLAVVYWLCDVWVEEEHRGKGVGKKLVETIVNNENLKNLKGILGTNDAHGLYEKFGFIKDDKSFMRR
ncbi:MAG: GNAT family N-acetyltransferase [Spirochaetes bacterium]|nr:GNAT family N-acetyltransferase [Spirochaetota bacterium]